MTGRFRPTPGGNRRRTPEELDALLDGGTSGDLRLDELLTAARGPARPAELATPAPAVGVTPVDTPTAQSRARRVLTRLGTATLVTKVATGAVGAVVVGAAAVAGATHHLPGQSRPRPAPVVTPSQGPSDSSTRRAPRSDPASSGSATTRPSSGSASTSPAPSSGSLTVSGSGTAAGSAPPDSTSPGSTVPGDTSVTPSPSGSRNGRRSATATTSGAPQRSSASADVRP